MAVRRLLCLECANRAKKTREEHNSIVMFCTGTVQVEAPLGDVVFYEGDKEVSREKPKPPCVCDSCNADLPVGSRACAYQYWRGRDERIERHGWERDYLGGELVYEWRDW